MPSPLIFFIVIVVIDLILKSLRDKKKVEENRQKDFANIEPQIEKKPNSTIRELRRSIEDEFAKQKSKVENVDTRKASEEMEGSPRREGRVREARQELIKNQREKINKHSEMEKNRRLEKERIMTKARLSDSQVPLAAKDPKRKMDYVNLETRKPVTIEVEDTSRGDRKSKSRDMLNIEEDILKGIVYSEILSKPKSLGRK